MFFAEGIRLAATAAESGCPVETVVVAPELLRADKGNETAENLVEQGAARLEVSADVFRTISSRDNPQGLGIVAPQAFVRLEALELAAELCWVCLARPQDPGNVGAVLRSSAAIGGGGVILIDESVDPYDPRCVRASMGSIFSQMISLSDFSGFQSWALRNHCHVVGASADALTSYRDYEFRRPLVVLLGSERQGLKGEEVEACEAMISIPIVGPVDSLNLAVAAGVLLYEAFHRLNWPTLPSLPARS